MTAFYFAARVRKREVLRSYAEQLKRLGHTVTSRWLYEELFNDHANRGQLTVEQRDQIAIRDLVDIEHADVLVLFTEERDQPNPPFGNGRLVEFGWALGRQKECWVVGPRENLFTCLEGVRYAETWIHFYAGLWRFYSEARGDMALPTSLEGSGAQRDAEAPQRDG